MATKNPNNHIIMLPLPKDLWERVKAAAREEADNPTNWMRRAIARAVQKQGREE